MSSEEQFLLRLPPELAEKMRVTLSSKSRRGEGEPVPEFELKFTSEREAEVKVDGASIYRATMKDLPAICETHKTSDKRNYFKSGDVHQVLVVDSASKREASQPAAEEEKPNPEVPMDYSLPDGLTPGAKGAAKRFVVPPPLYPPEVVSTVEEHMKYILDNKITLVRKRDEGDQDEVVEVHEDTEGHTAPKDQTASAPSTKPDEPTPSDMPVGDSQATPADAGQPADDATQANVDLNDMPEFASQEMPPPAREEEDEDMNEFAEMLAEDLLEEEPSQQESMAVDTEHMVARRRIELEKLQKAVMEQKKVVADLEVQVEQNPNPIMKKRLEAKLDTAVAELRSRESAVRDVATPTG